MADTEMTINTELVFEAALKDDGSDIELVVSQDRVYGAILKRDGTFVLTQAVQEDGSNVGWTIEDLIAIVDKLFYLNSGIKE